MSIKTSAFLALLLALAGCGTRPAATAGLLASTASPRADVGTLTYRAVDRMLAAAPDLTLGHTAVVVGSIADVQRLSTSSPLGNIIADMLRDRLSQRGVAVTELRLRSAMLMDSQEGEMALARNRHAIMAPPRAGVIATGTYAVGEDHVYVSIKLVAADTARILAGADYAIGRQGDVETMARNVTSR